MKFKTHQVCAYDILHNFFGEIKFNLNLSFKEEKLFFIMRIPIVCHYIILTSHKWGYWLMKECIIEQGQTITWINDESLSIKPLGTNFSENWIKEKQLQSRKCRLLNGDHFVSASMFRKIRGRLRCVLIRQQFVHVSQVVRVELVPD